MSVAILTFAQDDAEALQKHATKISGDVVVLDAQNDPDLSGYSHVLCVATNESKNHLAKLGAQLDVQPITDVVDIVNADTFVRPVYAGNALATVQSSDPVKLISIRTGRSASQGTGSRELSKARVVVSGGRALGSKENFKLIEEAASTLNGAVGATRAAVDAGYIGNETQIGQTGKVIAPDLYIACGVSGAIQHVGGIRGAKTVIAINTDANAPIFRHATYGFVGDLFEVLPALIKRFTS